MSLYTNSFFFFFLIFKFNWNCYTQKDTLHLLCFISLSIVSANNTLNFKKDISFVYFCSFHQAPATSV